MSFWPKCCWIHCTLEEHLLEAAAPGLVRFSCIVRSGGCAFFQQAWWKKPALWWARWLPVRSLPETRQNPSGRPFNPELIAEAASLAARLAKPLDNTDFDMSWRKKGRRNSRPTPCRSCAGMTCKPSAGALRRFTRLVEEDLTQWSSAKSASPRCTGERVKRYSDS